ncbi:MAG TPA: type II secretion system inner membrane protein GspF [Gammaproteobacteria bacterium]|nr:type II secretion system inner membrane protein GspF [Gammaproteobacteria bacterium]
MPAFEYTAINPKGREQRGVMEGDNARAVRQLLREQNLTPLSVVETNKTEEAAGGKPGFKLRSGVNVKDLALLTRQLSTLMRSGVPLEEALATVARQTNKNSVKGVILSTRSKVLEGHSFAAALREQPRVFPDLYCATVSAGEQSGHLDPVLERLADYTEARQEMAQKINMALMYPIILTVLSIAIITGLLTYVVPQIVQVFENVGQELPLMTRVLIGASDLMRSYGIWILLLLGGGIYLAKRALESPVTRFRYHQTLLKLPLIGELTKGVNTARFARTLSILTASGVPILDALRISGQVVRNLPMRQAIEVASARVREGSNISRSLEQSGLFPPITIHMIASGESSGKLEEMLERAALYQERETTSTITTFVGLFEHMMILIMGGVVLMIVLAILLPVMELNQLVK